MKQYQQWLNKYQEMAKGSLGTTNLTALGLGHWQRHLEFMRALTEASMKVATATGEYMQSSMSQAASGWQEVTKVTTDEVMQHQDRIRQKVRSSS